MLANTEMDLETVRGWGRRESGHGAVYRRRVWIIKGTVSTEPKVGRPTQICPTFIQNQNKQYFSAAGSKHEKKTKHFWKEKIFFNGHARMV